jgi:hypothetical protein
MIIIFAGNIGRFPIGGIAWWNMHYLVGLHGLGHEVFYLEECGEGSWVYNWETEEVTTELDYPTAYIQDCLGPIGFGSRWIYRAGDRSVGMPIDAFRSICSKADLLIVLASPLDIWREEYDWPIRRIYIDGDPGFTQFRLINGDHHLVNTVNRCERLFTIGQRIDASDCTIPTVGRRWLKTVFPISLLQWDLARDMSANHFTTIMQWHSYKEVVYDGVRYGNKDKEFPKFIHLPTLTSQPFRIALTGGQPGELIRHGWEVGIGWMITQTPRSYKEFIDGSRAEFAVVKHGYVSTKGGWFGDRSICYLASGRPVLVQDTGLSDCLPVGKGLLTFRDVPEALRGIDIINSDYEQHCRAARLLAEQYFSADRVLVSLLQSAME